MSEKYNKLKSQLLTLFQLDQPELDFGIYRIMHMKKDDVMSFLDDDLLPQVSAAFKQYQSADKVELEKKLAEQRANAEALGIDPELAPKVVELRKVLANSSVDIGSLEGDVYDHLSRFFSRYYSEGDFISKRVYKNGVYALPYQGEEVKLSWANEDQYYIKSSETLRNYSFRLNPHDDANPLRVNFGISDAVEGEHSDVKESDDANRVFVLAANDSVVAADGELHIKFEHRPASKNDWPADEREGKKVAPKQADLIRIAVERVRTESVGVFTPWVSGLLELAPTVADKSRTVLAKNIERFSKRNTFDYFVHKNLGGFLRQELDFYIKNEVMHLDDIENDTVPRVEQYLSMIRVIRKIAVKIIDFLAQIEEFQKKLWLKKKFVVATNYIVRMDLIPTEFYSEVLKSLQQRQEWRDNLGIDCETAEDLSKDPSLAIDTQHYSKDFVEKLLESIGEDVSLDEATDGVLVHSENFQALSALDARWREQIDTIYIDPPYNTDASAIDYKNGYKSSSWMTLIDNRVRKSTSLLKPDGVNVAAIDDEQHRELNFILSNALKGGILGTICVRSNPSGRPMQSGYSVSHEYLLFAGNSKRSRIARMPPTEAQLARFSQHDDDGPFEWRNLRREGSDSDRSARPFMYFPIYIGGESIRVPQMTWDANNKCWSIDELPSEFEHAIWPDNEAGDQKRWRWEWKTVAESSSLLAVRKDRSNRDYVYYKRRPHDAGVVSVSSWFDAKFSATEHGTAVLKRLFGSTVFSYPKSIYAVEDAVYVAGAANREAQVLDYFAGSGTTGHAIINLNRRDGGSRKFILVEMGRHFDTVLMPRLKKVIFSPEWKDGKPQRAASREETSRSPRIVKTVRLESYEDTLNNLVLRRSPEQNALLSNEDVENSGTLAEDYLLRYMLDAESEGNNALVNIDAFSQPDRYELLLKSPGSDESKPIAVDLLETFNSLLGLRVNAISATTRVAAKTKRDNEGRLVLDGRLREDASGEHWFRAVDGNTVSGQRVLVIWRNMPGFGSANGLERDNLVLNEWFAKQGYSTTDQEYDLVYVNGNNTIGNLKLQGSRWKVRATEEEFLRLMFDESEL